MHEKILFRVVRRMVTDLKYFSCINLNKLSRKYQSHPILNKNRHIQIKNGHKCHNPIEIRNICLLLYINLRE